MTIAEAKAAHDWDMAAMIASAWTEVDFSANPFRGGQKSTSGTFDTEALRREVARRKRKKAKRGS